MAPLNNLNSLDSSNPTASSEFDVRSPLEVADSLRGRDLGTSVEYNPGHSVLNPNDINNVGFFVLFALIGLAFVVSAIWFFFWAKNGGFHFRKGDWQEYKSTVLRRKGPDGKTLSNATKSTKLGGGSVVGSEYTDGSYTSYRDSEKGSEPAQQEQRRKKRKHKKANKYDADVREYRAEKPARVGGLNKTPDGTGTVHDWSTAPSNLSSQPAVSEAPRNHHHRHSSKNQGGRRDFSFNQGSEASFSAISSDVSSNAPLRPQAAQRSQGRHEHKRNSSSAANPKQYQANRARRSQGFYAARASEGTYREPIDFSDTQSGRAPSEAQIQNTKSYKHTIPGLSKGPTGVGAGFRRGGGGRRDSLSDSDDGTYMS